MSDDLLLRIATALERIATVMEASRTGSGTPDPPPRADSARAQKLVTPWQLVVTDPRIRNFLEWRKAKTVDDVLGIPDFEILKIKQVGRVRLRQLRDELLTFLNGLAA